jgi:hypothetical protein
MTLLYFTLTHRVHDAGSATVIWHVSYCNEWNFYGMMVSFVGHFERTSDPRCVANTRP